MRMVVRMVVSVVLRVIVMTKTVLPMMIIGIDLSVRIRFGFELKSYQAPHLNFFEKLVGAANVG